MTEATVLALAEMVDGTVSGDGDVKIRGVNELRQAGPHDLGFVRDRQFIEAARASEAGAVVVEQDLGLRQPQIVVRDPYIAFATIASHFHPPPDVREHTIHPTAVIDPTAQLEEPVDVGPGVVVGPGVRIGGGTLIRVGVSIDADVRIGRNCTLHSRVSVYHGVALGDRVTVHAGTVIGSDGFGYAPQRGQWIKIPQIGSVVIGDDVEIGANCAIDRGTLGDTRIGRGTKIDNLVHVGHNCVLGEDNAVAAFSAFAGSTTLGDRVTIAGHTVFAGHLHVTDDVRIGGNSVVHGDVTKAGDYMGFPLLPMARWARTLRVLERLPDLQPQLRKILPKKRREPHD